MQFKNHFYTFKMKTQYAMLHMAVFRYSNLLYVCELSYISLQIFLRN